LKTILFIVLIFFTSSCSNTKMVPAFGRDLEVLGCPALIQWTAREVGIEDNRIQTWMVQTLSKDIQPCEACERFRQAAAVLQDSSSARLAALVQIINGFALSHEPPSSKQMEDIAKIMVQNVEAGNSYALAGEYLDAIVECEAFLTSEMHFSAEEAKEFIADKYLLPQIEFKEIENR